MTTIRCLVVDDEPLAIDIVVNYLQRLDIAPVATANNAVEAFRYLQQQSVDLIFLDIQMPQLTGFDLLNSLPSRPLVVFTTAYRDYAVEGFEWSALDYLVKPFSFARFLQTMEKATRALQSPAPTPSPAANRHSPADPASKPEPAAKPGPAPSTRILPPLSAEGDSDFIFLKTDRHLTRVATDSILYIESLKDYIRVFTTGGDYVCHQSLTDITARLPAAKFVRIHRSFTVALAKIDRVRQHCAHIGDSVIPISRANRRELYARLGK